MLGLQYFTFEELWTPWFLFGMAAIVILYFYLIGPWREKHNPQAPAATGMQKALFVSAIVLLYLAHGGPLNLLGHLMFTFHMVNMSISYLIVPPMVLLGVPSFVWRKMFSAGFWKKFSLLMHPIITIVLFNMLFSIYHVPVVHDYVMTHFTVHRLYYLVLLVTSFMMWWQIASPVPEWSKLTDLKKMAYVFANGVLLTPACALIIFANESMYAIYSDPNVWVTAMGYCVSGDPSRLLESFSGPQFFNLMDVKEDQQTGGIIMKLVQELMYGIILAYIFKQWFKKEHTEDELPNSNPNTGTA
ncbi:cytochrome c oxidase assembly factor CtaG [Paenibacillus arenilitoris]|uniref:Cytochrome c oxidase assembly factor CtaG n=1 Tax=Paenibacillus arenilitoris TaxID=2772299 RepID=A0A927H515_9BACL|nr:cytochrome c oxidase assembly factor CtaG [Paenibacillus arenilitoris]MBD2868460.1 cytochrome c oxidase assembly factor CtaG [Paenibacillus arenilitoris]